MKDSIKLYISTLQLSFKISFRASRSIMFIRMMTLVAGAIIPLVNARAMKSIIDAAIIAEISTAIKWLMILSACQILSAVIVKVTNYLSTIHSDRIALLISQDIASKVNELDISYFDNPQLYNEILNVTGDVKAIPSLVWQVLSSVQLFIKIASSSVILFGYISYSPLIIIISCLPSLFVDKKYALKMYEWNRSTTSETRKMGYSYDTLTSKYFSKDVRLHNLKNYLFDKYKAQWVAWHNKKYSILKKQFWTSFVVMILPNATTLILAAIILHKIFAVGLTPGDFSYYISTMSQLTASVAGLFSVVTEIINQKIKIEYYNNFKSWKSNLTEGNKTINSFEDIAFENVSFIYPNTEKTVLKNISFKIHKNQKVGIIGKNGSGKTTIIKLILRLYEPTEGRILLNGIDIKDYKICDYYSIISAFMQDYVNYSFTLEENIRTADLMRKNPQQTLQDACEKSDALSFVETWENGFNQFLTKSYDENGKELSGGQWQKIALARFFFRDACFKIMDEPSSAIDIEAERKIFSHVINDKKSTLILISHRLSNMKLMDQILVVDNGEIIENGNHNALMREKGLYYRLFSVQKENFS